MSETERYLDREAIVVRSLDAGEADRLVWVVSREEGRMRALARGARRAKARLGGSLQPLSLVRLTLYRGRRLSVIGAAVLKTWRTWKATYEGTLAAAFMAEILFWASPEGDEAQAPFDLAVAAFDAVEFGAEVLPTALAFARDLLAATGWGIDFKTCSLCGRPLTGEAYLRPGPGMVTHGHCAREGYALDAPTRLGLAGGPIPEASRGRLLEALLTLWQNHLEGPLRTAPGLRRVLGG